jgi:glycosyltransferase involved in cell wall biosynthesis
VAAEDLLVSTIVPVYNGERFLAEGVASVRSQDYGSLEIIVVDDGSTDSTPRLARALGADVCYVRQDNRGPADARNAGLAVARGDVIAFLDADDLWCADRLAHQLAILAADPTMDVVWGRSQIMMLDENASGDGGQFLPFSEPWHLTLLGSALYRRRAFERVGTFDSSLEASSDADWFLRARERNLNVGLSEEVALLYRLHHTNLSRDADFRRRHFLRALKRSIDRRRDAPGASAAEAGAKASSATSGSDRPTEVEGDA